MKKEFAMKWADTLESGEYNQTTGVLFDGQGYCCLGVLCKMLGKSFFEKNGVHYVIDVSDDDPDDLYFYGVLPSDIMHVVEMKTNDGEFEIKYEHDDEEEVESLTGLNDSGKTFKEIAAVIRENWSKL